MSHDPPWLPATRAGRRADPRERVAALYRWYGEVEAPGRSELFAQFALAVAHDPRLIAFLAGLPSAKWQPNLLLAAVRYLYGTPRTARDFVSLALSDLDAIEKIVTTRRTQTNEPARCATLLPALARLPQPLALLEVGASAGLCLLPDHYSFAYGEQLVPASVPARGAPAPVFRCRADAATPVPRRNVEVVWRAGLDLHPIDVRDEAELRWLEALVWPGQDERLAGLRAACEIAWADPPRVVQGDLLTDLPALAASAPPEATLVVFHTAVLAYVRGAEARAAFARAVAGTEAAWIANERPVYIPGVAPELEQRAPDPVSFLLSVDGRPTAWTDPHGAAISWCEDGAW